MRLLRIIPFAFVFALISSAYSVNADYKQYTMDDLDNVYLSISDDGAFMFFGQERGLADDPALYTLSYKNQNCNNLLFPTCSEKNIRTYKERMNDFEVIKEKYAKPCIDKLNNHLKNIWEEWDADRDAREVKRGANLHVIRSDGGNYQEDDIPSKSHLYNMCFLGEEKMIQGTAKLIDNNHIEIVHGEYKDREEIIGKPFSFIINKYDINFLLDELNAFYGDQYDHYIDLVEKYGLTEIPVEYSEGSYTYNISLDELDNIDKIKGAKDENCVFTVVPTEFSATEFYPAGNAVSIWTIGTDTFKENAEGVKVIYFWKMMIGIFILISVVVIYKKKKLKK